MRSTATLILLLCSLCTNILCTKKKKEKLNDGDYCYVDPHCDPSKWDGICNSGTRQSPINLDGEKMGYKILPPTYRQFYAFSTSPETKQFIIQNTGQTIQVQFPFGTEPTLKGATIGLPGSYKFFSMTFHWGRFDKDGSEHRISGKGYALELQLVHFSTNYANYAQASGSQTDPYAIAIISILYDVGKLDSLALRPIVDAIPMIRQFNNFGEVTVNRFLNLRAFFPPLLSFYRYEGSNTIPSCLENRVWTVFRQPNKISKKQLQEFRSMFQRDNIHLMVDNHRPIQKRHDRAVTLYFTPTNRYDVLMQLAIYIYTFVRQIMTMPADILQDRIKVLLKPFNLQNGLLGIGDAG